MRGLLQFKKRILVLYMVYFCCCKYSIQYTVSISIISITSHILIVCPSFGFQDAGVTYLSCCCVCRSMQPLLIPFFILTSGGQLNACASLSVETSADSDRGVFSVRPERVSPFSMFLWGHFSQYHVVLYNRSSIGLHLGENYLIYDRDFSLV